MVIERRDHSALKGANVLVVDDEFLIASNIEYLLTNAGANVSVAITLGDALERALSERLSAALLDIRLGKQTSEAVAQVLTRRGIPFLFFSGQPVPDAMQARFANARALSKPLAIQSLLHAMDELVRSRPPTGMLSQAASS